MPQPESEQVLTPSGPTQEGRSIPVDELIAGVTSISPEDILNNPKAAIHLLISLLKEKGRECRTRESEHKSALQIVTQLTSDVAVYKERLAAKERLLGTNSFYGTAGGVIVTLASLAKDFIVGPYDLRWLLMLL